MVRSLSLAMIFNLSKKDFRPNKEFSSVELIELTSPAYKYNYQVEITLNKDNNTSIEYKDAPNLIKWRNTYNYGFNTFQAQQKIIKMKTPYFNKTNEVSKMVFLTNRTEFNMINKFRENRERLRNDR